MEEIDPRPGKMVETEPDPYGSVPDRFDNPNVIEREMTVRFNPNPGGEDPAILKGYRVVKKFD